MADRSSIEWTDASWNAMRGCSRTIAAGAETSGCGDPTGGGCYAERNGYRFAGPGLPYEGLVRMTPNGARWTGNVMLVDKHLLDPLRWERPRRIFTTSADVAVFVKQMVVNGKLIKYIGAFPSHLQRREFPR